MDSLIQWLADLMFAAETHQIVAAAIITGVITLLAAVVAYLWRLWRNDEKLVARGIADVTVRTRLYLRAIERNPPSVRGRDQQYLRETVERWTATKARSCTDFQLYLAIRRVERLLRSPDLAGNYALDQLVRTLRAALVAAPGDPDMNPAWAILNNAIATLFGMRPSVRDEPAARSGGADSLSAEWDPMSVLGIPDPFVMESRLKPLLDEGPPDLLHQLLAAVETACREYGFVTFRGSQLLLAEMVLWILHEERSGPALLTPEVRMLRELSIQLTPQLPAFLQTKPLRSIEQPASDQLRIIFQADPPLGDGAESVFNLSLSLELLGHHWIANSVDFELGSEAALIFRRADSMRTKNTPPVPLTISSTR